MNSRVRRTVHQHLVAAATNAVVGALVSVVVAFNAIATAAVEESLVKGLRLCRHVLFCSKFLSQHFGHIRNVAVFDVCGICGFAKCLSRLASIFPRSPRVRISQWTRFAAV